MKVIGLEGYCATTGSAKRARIPAAAEKRMGFCMAVGVPLFATTGLSLVARAWMNSLRSLCDSLSGGDVGIELSLDPGDLVFEEKFATLHSGEGELIVGGVVGDPVNGGVQVPVLELQLVQPLPHLRLHLFVPRFDHGTLLF